MPSSVYPQTARDSTSTIIEGNARFQFLTPSMVRMEYSATADFVDAPTVVVKKRSWHAVSLGSKTSGGWVTIKTSVITLWYKLNTGSFNSDNLSVSWHDSSGFHDWHPGNVDSLNLGGLTYSLDGVSEENLPKVKVLLASPAHDTIPGINVILPEAQPGLLSLNGYAFINDSRTPIRDERTNWIKPRPDTVDQDWYLIIYGRNYREALKDYAELSGHIPMIPRYVLGPWITDMNFEYFPNSYQSRLQVFNKYNEQHLKEEVMKFRDNDIPLDIFVFDFGWHNYGWEGGYDWSPLVPQPRQFLNWLGEQGIKVTLNDHPGYTWGKMSILSYEDSKTPEVLRDLGKPLPTKPTFDIDISAGWKFTTDPKNQGVTDGWYAENYDDGNWKPIKVGEPWDIQGNNDYHGTVWYRQTVSLPSNLPDSIYLYLGEVTGSYHLYVNGHEIPHGELQWPQRLICNNISPFIKAGQENAIAIRINNQEGGGGITMKPVSLENVAPPPLIYFNLANKKQAEVFMNDLHKPLMQEGVKFWWVDGGSGAANMQGLNPQLWTNRVYYDYTEKETGKRGFIFSRYGGWGSQRYPAFFTGDTYSQWPVLAYEVTFTAAGGNVLVPYITNDIGGFHGAKIPFDLYARWIEFGTFSPILRLHSAHENPYEGDVRMPWTYGEEGMSLAKKYFSLRTRLIPYIYTYTRLAHEESVPVLRPLYLEYPHLKEAYEHPHEYFFGNEMLVAPVIDSTGNRSVYLPPGKWIGLFSGKKYDGGTTLTAHFKVDETPVFVHEGSIIPEQPDMAYSNQKPLNPILIKIYGSGHGKFDLYEDDGVSLKYRDGQFAWTPIAYSTNHEGSHQVSIGPTKGSYQGQLNRRSYDLYIRSIAKPRSVTVNGQIFKHWAWDSEISTAVIRLPQESIRRRIVIEFK